MTLRRRAIAAGLLALLCTAAAAADAGSREDAERARVRMREGRHVPLASILDWLEARYRGKAIEVELEADDEPPTYEIEWLTPAGDVVEFEFDARTGALLEREGRGLEAAER